MNVIKAVRKVLNFNGVKRFELYDVDVLTDSLSLAVQANVYYGLE